MMHSRFHQRTVFAGLLIWVAVGLPVTADLVVRPNLRWWTTYRVYGGLLALGPLRSGARGYLLKDVTLDHLVAAIRTVSAGGRQVTAREV